MKILVTGATGTVGGQVLRLLLGQGHAVRALVRDSARAELPAEVEVVQGDLTDPDDVRRALDGVDRAFLNMADDNGAQFAAVAGVVGLGHVVLLSSFTAVVALPSGDANIVSARHRAGEQALTEARVPSTFLRAAGFDYNILTWAGGATDGVIRAPHPDVELPIVDPADIAASAVAVLLADTPPAGAYSITGPEKLSVREQVQVLSEVLGRDLRVEQISEDQAKRDNFPAGTPDVVSTSVLETMSPAASVLEPSGDVQTLAGHAPRSFRTWAAEHADAFAHLMTDETAVSAPLDRSVLELDPAVRRMIEATNAEDTPGFLATFAEDAVVDDWGRRFSGRGQIAEWNDRENIGTHNRIAVTDVRGTADGVTLTIQVSGDGYNGGGTFTILSNGETIRSLVIRG